MPKPLKNWSFELWCWRRLLRAPWIARRSNQSILRKSDLNIHWKDWCWSWNCNTLATWCNELTHLKRPWCWERLKAGGEEDDSEWDGWMASPTQWVSVWVNSGSWWWTGRPGMLWSMESQSQTQLSDLTELNWGVGEHVKLSNENSLFGKVDGSKVKVKVAQLCLTLGYPMDYTVHGYLQTRMLERVAYPFSKGSSQPRDRTQLSCVIGRFFTSWATGCL